MRLRLQVQVQPIRAMAQALGRPTVCHLAHRRRTLQLTAQPATPPWGWAWVQAWAASTAALPVVALALAAALATALPLRV